MLSKVCLTYVELQELESVFQLSATKKAWTTLMTNILGI